jgi:hypothetical protein
MLASSSNSSVFTTRTANELMWGYEDPLLKLVSQLDPTVNPYFQLQVNQTSEQQADNTTGSDLFLTGKSNLTVRNKTCILTKYIHVSYFH